jgi:transposase, IS30 family
MKTRKSFKQLQDNERMIIEKLLEKEKGIRYIAEILDRSPGTISNEIKRNSVKGIYSFSNAKQKLYNRKMNSKQDCMKVAMNSFIQKKVLELLEKRHSPREISGHLKVEYQLVCSSKAIYKFIYSRCMEDKLFWSWNKRKTGPKCIRTKGVQDDRKYIEQRPIEVTVSDWEMDFIVSKQSSFVLLVLVNRVTRYSVVVKLLNRKYTTIKGVLSRLVKHYSMKTITTDNDVAFTKWKQLETILHITIYFCHPYHSWEKGLVENTNRWIRCFVPKRKDIRLVTELDLNNIDSYLNHKYRAVTLFKSPYWLQLQVLKCSI